MEGLDEIRIRLGRADENGQKAWHAATGQARRILNAGPAPGESDRALATMQSEIHAMRKALEQLEEVHELLARHAGHKAARRVGPFHDEKPCVKCGRVDALVPVPVCARCSGLGPFAGLRW